MSAAWGGHGGGGFGGFPYRGAHQQGSDGSQRRRHPFARRRGRRQRANKKVKQQAKALLCAADLFVPEHCRGRLIGRGGATIRQLTTECNVKIHIPRRDDRQQQLLLQPQQHRSDSTGEEDRRPVRIKAEHIANLLHASWRILTLLSTASGMMTIQCRFRIPDNTPSQKGYLQREAPFFVQEDPAANDNSRNNTNANNSNHRLVAYCVESFLDAEEVETLVDNERFTDAEVTAQFETVYQDDSTGSPEGQPTTLIFVYGTPQLEKPKQLAMALENATLQLWREYNDSMMDQAYVHHHHPAATSIMVGTYNLLYPNFALRYESQQGLNRRGMSNWEFRAPVIARILLQSNLDLYLLQEVPPGFLSNIQKLSEMYHIVQYTHPSPSELPDMIRAGDAVAILIRKERFVVHKQEMVPFRLLVDSSKSYMCAATALVEDVRTKLRYWVASTHFYTKKALNPQETLLQFLQEHRSECDGIIWGGDCNDEYSKGTSLPDGCTTVLHDNNKDIRPTRLHKKIDWIFFSEDLAGTRSEPTEAFIQATTERLEPTGYPPSDHYGEALKIKNNAE